MMQTKQNSIPLGIRNERLRMSVAFHLNAMQFYCYLFILLTSAEGTLRRDTYATDATR